VSNKRIKDEHTLARHCASGLFADPIERTELDSKAFAPTDSNPSISVNWLEFYDGDHASQLKFVRTDIANGRTVRRTHKLALLNVGEVKALGMSSDQDLSVAHDPLPDNQSHSLICGIPIRDKILHQRLADAASKYLVEAVE